MPNLQPLTITKEDLMENFDTIFEVGTGKALLVKLNSGKIIEIREFDPEFHTSTHKGEPVKKNNNWKAIATGGSDYIFDRDEVYDDEY